MKFTDKFFKFPVRLYLTKDIEDHKNKSELLGMDLPEDFEPESIIGWEHVDIMDICGFGAIFSKGKTIDEVRENGFDSTIVYLKYGKEVGCCWSPSKFESKLNEFYEKYEAARITHFQHLLPPTQTTTTVSTSSPESL